MIARDRRKTWLGAVAGVAAVGLFGSGSATGQQSPARGKAAQSPVPPPRTTPADRDAPAEEQGKIVRRAVNPSDAVAVVNGETITRAQLAEEAYIREGEKVLEAMISRKVIEQAMKANKITVTPQEIDAEIDKYANNIAGITREQWLTRLAQEKKINPISYKNDIVYPGLALRKLAENRVQVTEQDMKDAMEAQYGDKLRVRIILTMQERDAVAMWNELKKNPGGFAHMASNDVRSVDDATKVHGGLLEQALTRHAYPREVSDKAFQQLVDGDPDDKDPAHKPKDGAMTGPIQVTESTWILMRREGLIPKTDYDPKNEKVRETMKSAIFDAKLKEAMNEVFEELVKKSNVENVLTGQTKVANDDRQPGGQMTQQVPLMSDPNTAVPSRDPATAAVRPKASAHGVSAEDRATADAALKRTAAGAGATKKK